MIQVNRTQHAAIWRLAGPIMLSNITVALLGIVDTAVLGHLDKPQYLGGITLATVVFNFLYWGLAFLRMGTTGLVAQTFGSSDANRLRAVLFQAFVLAMLLAVSILLLQQYILYTGLYFLEGSDEVKRFASDYYFIAIWAAPAVLINFVITGWLLGVEQAKMTLVIAVVINVINIVLDLYFVFVLQMNIKGVALATVIAQYVGIVIALFLVRRVLKLNPGHWHKQQLINLSSVRRMLSVNHNLFIRTVCLLFCFAFFTHQGAAEGDLVLAANAVLMNFYFLMALALDGFAMAAEVLTGKAIGARDRAAFWHSVKVCSFWSLLFAVLFAVVFYFAGKLMINLMTDIESIRAIAYNYLIWLVIAPLITTWCFMWDGIYTGSTRAKEMRDTMLFSVICVFFPAWYLLQGLGNNGLWLALTLFMVSRSVSMTFIAWRIELRQGFVPTPKAA